MAVEGTTVMAPFDDPSRWTMDICPEIKSPSGISIALVTPLARAAGVCSLEEFTAVTARSSGSRRSQPGVEQAQLAGVGGFLVGDFLQADHGSAVDHAGINVLSVNVEYLEAFGGGQVFAHADDFSVVHEDGAVLNHRSGDGVDGAAAQQIAGVGGRCLRPGEPEPQSARASDYATQCKHFIPKRRTTVLGAPGVRHRSAVKARARHGRNRSILRQAGRFGPVGHSAVRWNRVIPCDALFS